MCSIFGIFGLQPGDDLQALRRQALECSQRQRHRGPDWSGVYVDAGAILVHERLAIVDPAGGSQPLLSEDGSLALAVNGEIYNHRELKAELLQPYAFQTGSDCEVINALYREDAPASYLNRLNGIFAFALWDKAAGRVIIARDPIGAVVLGTRPRRPSARGVRTQVAGGRLRRCCAVSAWSLVRQRHRRIEPLLRALVARIQRSGKCAGAAARAA